MKLEDVVRQSHWHYLNFDRTLPDSSVSSKSTSDYVLYVIEIKKNIKLVLVEVARNR